MATSNSPSEIKEYLSQNADITTGQPLDQESIIGSVVGGVRDASKKFSQTLGSFKNALNTNPITSTLMGITKKLITNGEGFYDPQKNQVLIGGLKIKGVVDCTIKRDSVAGVDVGLDGTAIPYLTKNSMATMTLTLLRTSPSTGALAHAYNLIRNTEKGLLEVIIQENGETVMIAKAILTTLPDIKLDMEGSDLTYEFKLINI